MKEVKEFTISREKWLRGDDGDSYLLRPFDGKQCCLGIYMEECGVSRDVLYGKSLPFIACGEMPVWLYQNEYAFKVVKQLLATNDCKFLSEKEREEKLSAKFAELGIIVQFVD